MRTKVTIIIGHLENEVSQSELKEWLKSQLQKMLDTQEGMTSYMLEMDETSEIDQIMNEDSHLDNPNY